MTSIELARLKIVAARVNDSCDKKGLPYRAHVQSIYLDFGSGWMDYSIVIRNLTKPTHDICATYQVNFCDRDAALSGDYDKATAGILKGMVAA